MANEAALRSFCARILGFANDRAVDHARRSLELAADHRAALVLLGETDLMPIAHALHRRTLGADREGRNDAHPFLALPAPIRVPSLRVRTDELSRIVDEYAIDAVAELRALRASFTDADRQWVLDNAPLTLPEIEKATLRLVAIPVSRNMSDAAARLGMAPVSLRGGWVAGSCRHR